MSYHIKAPEINPGVFISGTMYVHPGQSTDPQKRSSSYPYIARDTLRAFCTYVFDETKIPFKPACIKNGDTIFLNAELLECFFTEIHPLIKNKYILVTHASDTAIPGKYKKYLEDDTLAAWFGINVEIKHPKMIPIPIGIANNYWPHGNTVTLSRMIMSAPVIPKNKLLYMNFTISTDQDKRKPVYDLFIWNHTFVCPI
jgi:hypothetical protein